MGENGDRARGLAERALVALVLEPVEPVADVRRQVGVPAADLGDPVGVLDDPDRLASGVAVDVGRRARRSVPPRTTASPRSSPGRPCRARPSLGRGRARRGRARARRLPRPPRAGQAAAGGAEQPARAAAARDCGPALPGAAARGSPRSAPATSSSLLPPAGIQTSCPSIRTSIGSSHPSPPSSSMSEVCGIRPRVAGTCGSRSPATRKFSSSAA